jgi:hypothetical protein
MIIIQYILNILTWSRGFIKHLLMFYLIKKTLNMYILIVWIIDIFILDYYLFI